MRLYVNIDHVATVREARKTDEPDPVRAAVLVELAGADGITVHLREDRRHIQDRDVHLLLETVRTLVNLEVASSPEMVSLAAGWAPAQATLVPEKRAEITTEGGLALSSGESVAVVGDAVATLRAAGVKTALFIDPDPTAISAAVEVQADAVELHTGEYANASGADKVTHLERLRRAAELARERGLGVHAGHGLTYHNVIPVSQIDAIEELNIGHSVVSRAVFVGLERAVREMKALLRPATG